MLLKKKPNQTCLSKSAVVAEYTDRISAAV